MSSFRLFSLLVLCAAPLARAQTVPPAAPPSPAARDGIQHLDKFVVSAGHDPKTSFDLAQGTSVLAGEELHRLAQSTLGETLSGLAGVSATYHGPGASRPIIRGLGGDRVRVLDNGVGSLDASNISPDHHAALDPLFASRIEVLRGPATLLYGGAAIGGVVNVIDNAIPDTAPDGKARGAVELRGGGASRERAALLSVGGGANAFSTQVNVLQQKTGDARIPGVARVDDDAPRNQPRGTLPGSASDTFSGSFGASVFFGAGRAGGAISHLDNEYGVPKDADHPIRIRLRQTRLDLEGEVTRPFGLFEGARARFGTGRYKHSELSDETDIHATFTNEAWEGRLELPHAEIGPFSGTIGLQTARSDFASEGEEVFAPPSLTQSIAVFALEELKFGPRATLQVGARYEGQSIRLGDIAAGLPRVPGYAARSGQEKKFGGGSGSLGLVVYPAKDWSIGTAVAYSERLPTAQELFANGPHGGTAAYEVGTASLGNERSLGVDVSVRRREGFITGSVGAFVNRFHGYIFQRELPETAIPDAANPEHLTPYQFVATDARFVGGEVEIQFHLLEHDRQRVHLDLSADRVRAWETGSGDALPRIPPVRYGARLSYEDGRWHALVEVRRAARQERTAHEESATPGYTLLNASVSYLIPTPRLTYELFARGRNLTNAEAREHTSFLKSYAPQPGRGVLAGVRMTF